jgi:hypothetical protein
MYVQWVDKIVHQLLLLLFCFVFSFFQRSSRSPRTHLSKKCKLVNVFFCLLMASEKFTTGFQILSGLKNIHFELLALPLETTVPGLNICKGCQILKRDLSGLKFHLFRFFFTFHFVLKMVQPFSFSMTSLVHANISCFLRYVKIRIAWLLLTSKFEGHSV